MRTALALLALGLATAGCRGDEPASHAATRITLDGREVGGAPVDVGHRDHPGHVLVLEVDGLAFDLLVAAELAVEAAPGVELAPGRPLRARITKVGGSRVVDVAGHPLRVEDGELRLGERGYGPVPPGAVVEVDRAGVRVGGDPRGPLPEGG